MAIKVITDFSISDTVRVWCYVYDEDNALVDPTGITINIYDPDGTLEADNAAMTQSETGIYYYDYHKGTELDPMAKGRWRGEVKTVDGTLMEAKYSTGDFSFKVK